MLAYSELIDSPSHSKSCALVYTSSTSVATTSLMLAVIGGLQFLDRIPSLLVLC